jgi:hypothetical protein
MSITDRKPREGEVLALLGDDGNTCIAVIKRSDGLFWCFEDMLIHDQDEDVCHWVAVQGPCSGIYGTIAEAELDTRSRIR